MAGPSFWSVATRSLRYYWRTHAALALGVAAATAVIVGALVVGDTVRISLRRLVTQRLANVEAFLHARVFFNPERLESVESGEFALVPSILFSSNTVEANEDGNLTRASRVQILAPESSFFGSIKQSEAEKFSLGEDEVALNAALAAELGVGVGDEITLVMTDPTGVPSDNPLGEREDRNIRLPRQKVTQILPDNSVGGISFVSSQAAPRNVFANLSTLQDLLECDGDVNGVLVIRPEGTQPTLQGSELCEQMTQSMDLELEDYGLELKRHRRIFPDPEIDSEEALQLPSKVVYDYWQLSSEQLIIDWRSSKEVINHFGYEVAEPTLTYVANTLAKVEPEARIGGPGGPRRRDPDDLQLIDPNWRTRMLEQQQPSTKPPVGREVPYSMVVGLMQMDAKNVMLAPHCWVNSWLAEQLDLAPGDTLQMKFFEPETVDGREREVERRFSVAGIVPITEPETPYGRRKPASFAEAPTEYNDPNLTPSVPGVTDQDSISDWDVPFELDKDKIKLVDDQYWRDYRLTPKVFLPYRYAENRKLFGSRFGGATAIRFVAEQIEDEESLREQLAELLQKTKPEKGLIFQPLRQQQMVASAGTTPFDMLFLSLSFFVIVAALLLVYLLFKLSIQQRQSELGVFQSQGFTTRRLRNLLASEFGIVAGAGTLLGVLLGVAYARGIIAGLESWWLGAISTRFLHFYASPLSLAIGGLAGLLCSAFAIFWGLRQATHREPLANLRGQQAALQYSSQNSQLYGGLALLGLVLAGALSFLGLGQSGIGRAGMFFGSGMLLLLSALLATRQLIQPKQSDSVRCNGMFSMAWRAIGRNPGRSILAVSLLAVAAFLIASMGVFQLSPTERGYGGFELIGQSSLPIYRNLGSAETREDVLGSEAAKSLLGSRILPMRAKFGEDASCNNLFQVAQPTILGVPTRLAELHDINPETVGFEWAGTDNPLNPWVELEGRGLGSEYNPIPCILDQNTAMWSLKQGEKLESLIEIELQDRKIYFQTVGLLSNSVLQGKLIISEANFKLAFPELSGYSYFMIRSSEKQDSQVVAQTLEKGWSNAGLDVQYSREILKNYLGVQNTYISAFQSLGALGLLLGTFGLIAVQVRSVMERQREFAVMRALGFAPSRVASLLSWETALLLGGGVLVGVLCSAIALVPYVLEVKPSLSFFNPLIMLGVVVLIGLMAALLSIRASSRRSVLEGLRSE